MSRASPGNSLPINSWKCVFDSILSTSNLKGGKKLFASGARSRQGRGGRTGRLGQAGTCPPV